MDPLKQHLLNSSLEPNTPQPPFKTCKPSLLSRVVIFVLCMGVPFAVGWNSYRISHGADWYGDLKKPSFMPPTWVFHAAWTVIYFVSGMSSYLLWNEHVTQGADINRPMFSYILSLFLHGAWSHLFFGQRWFTVATIDVALLWLSVVLCVITYRRVSRYASYMMMPYAGWLIWEFVVGTWIAINNPNGGRTAPEQHLDVTDPNVFRHGEFFYQF